MAAAASFQAIYHTINGGESWRQLVVPGEMRGGIIDIAFIDSLKIWIATADGHIFANQDAWCTWTKKFENSSLTNFMNYIEMFDESGGIAMGDNAEMGYFFASGKNLQQLYKTVDCCSNW